MSCSSCGVKSSSGFLSVCPDATSGRCTYTLPRPQFSCVPVPCACQTKSSPLIPVIRAWHGPGAAVRGGKSPPWDTHRPRRRHCHPRPCPPAVAAVVEACAAFASVVHATPCAGARQHPAANVQASARRQAGGRQVAATVSSFNTTRNTLIWQSVRPVLN